MNFKKCLKEKNNYQKHLIKKNSINLKTNYLKKNIEKKNYKNFLFRKT